MRENGWGEGVMVSLKFLNCLEKKSTIEAAEILPHLTDILELWDPLLPTLRAGSH